MPSKHASSSLKSQSAMINHFCDYIKARKAHRI
jgi:hypothetical protein